MRRSRPGRRQEIEYFAQLSRHPPSRLGRVNLLNGAGAPAPDFRLSAWCKKLNTLLVLGIAIAAGAIAIALIVVISWLRRPPPR
jgi:hypothetical protein